MKKHSKFYKNLRFSSMAASAMLFLAACGGEGNVSASSAVPQEGNTQNSSQGQCPNSLKTGISGNTLLVRSVDENCSEHTLATIDTNRNFCAEVDPNHPNQQNLLFNAIVDGEGSVVDFDSYAVCSDTRGGDTIQLKVR